MSPKMRFFVAVSLMVAMLTGCIRNRRPDVDNNDALEAAVKSMGQELSMTCELPCIGTVTSGYPMNCRRFGKNLILARDTMAHLVPLKNFCGAFAGIAVRVHDKDQIAHATGWATPMGIDLTKHGQALPEELFHHWDAQHGAVGTLWHQNWDTNGYYAASAVFRSKMIPLGATWVDPD